MADGDGRILRYRRGEDTGMVTLGYEEPVLRVETGRPEHHREAQIPEPRILANYNNGSIFSTASSVVITGKTSKSTMSLQCDTHSSSSFGFAVSISW